MQLVYLAIYIADVRAGWYSAVDPPRRSNLGDNVFRILDVLFEDWNHRGILLGKELLRNSTAFLTHAHLLGVEQ
jgi:hypothetical protein